MQTKLECSGDINIKRSLRAPSSRLVRYINCEQLERRGKHIRGGGGRAGNDSVSTAEDSPYLPNAKV